MGKNGLQYLVVSFAIAAIFVFSSILKADPTTAPTTLPSDSQIAALIQQLGADDYSTRQQAQAELVALGPAIKPALQNAASTSTSDEIRARAADAIKQIDLKIAEAPTLVTLHYKQGDPKAIIQDIIKQSHAQLQVWPPQMWTAQWSPAPKVSIDVDDVPFWIAISKFCDQANCQPQYVGGGNSIVSLMQGSIGPQLGGVLDDCGRFTIVAKSISHDRGVQFARGTTTRNDRIYFDVYVDPKADLVSFGQAKLDECVDDNGNSLVDPDQNLDRPMQNNSFTRWRFNIEAKLRYPDHYGQRITRLKGSFQVSLAAHTETLAIDDLAKAVNQTTSAAGRSIKVTSFTFDGNNGSANLHITRPPQRPRPGMVFNGFFDELRTIEVIDASGKHLNSNGGGGGSDSDINWTLNINSNNGSSTGPYKLVWPIVTGVKTIDQDFQFTDLPLPQP